jgi:hypothetical protein
MNPRARDQLGDFKDLGANFGCNRYSRNLVHCARRAVKGIPIPPSIWATSTWNRRPCNPWTTVRPEVVTHVLGTDRYPCLRSVPLCRVAETDESMVRTSARSPGHSRPYPRFSPAPGRSAAPMRTFPRRLRSRSCSPVHASACRCTVCCGATPDRSIRCFSARSARSTRL